MKKIRLFVFIVLSLSILSSCGSINSDEEKKEFNQIWSYKYDGDPVGLSLASLGATIINNQHIIISPDRRITSLNFKTGEVNWQQDVPQQVAINNDQLLYDENFLYVKLDQTNQVVSYDIASGKIRWNKKGETGDFFDYVNDGLSENQLYLAGDDSVIYQYSKSGEYQRELKLQHYARSILYNNGTLYVSQAWRPDGSEHAAGRIVAYDAETFEKRWEYETDKGGFYYAPMIYQNGRIYAGTTSGPSVFVTLDAATGEIIWEREGQVAYEYILENDTVYVNESLGLVALDARNGQELWSYQFTGDGQNNIAYQNSCLYHSHSSALFILDAATGEVVHREPVAPDGTPFGNVAAANGKVFAQSDYHLYAYEAWQ
jgi:outer membrane protein assembly factor BamB